MKIKICAIGECMMELTNAKHALYSQSIAGDTLNFTSYLDKKIFNTSYFTAVGTSDVSKRVISFLKKHTLCVCGYTWYYNDKFPQINTVKS